MFESMLWMLLAAQASPTPPTRYLLSIRDLPLRTGEYLDGFTIDTWGVTVLAVCRIPPGWRITAGNSANPDGTIAGEASHGVTFIPAGRPDALDDLVLMQLSEPVHPVPLVDATTFIPRTFDGHADIGTYGKETGRKAPIGVVNVRLIQTDGCPPVPRPQATASPAVADDPPGPATAPSTGSLQ